MKPLRLQANLVPRFYRGGGMIRAFRGASAGEGEAPEDWVASTTRVRGEQAAGLSRLPDGRLLAEVASAASEDVFGSDHVARYGATPALLVKLLDAGERLPVHFHPDRRFARDHFACDFGKTEAWVVVTTTGADPCVFLGFNQELNRARVRAWVDNQDRGALLASLNRIPVQAGDAILVPAGVPHAIGAGVFVAELQEPTDLSILLETVGYVGKPGPTAHLGLGWDLALAAVDWRSFGADDIEQLRGPGTRSTLGAGRVLPEIADPFFRAQLLRGRSGEVMDRGFDVLIVLDGDGDLNGLFGQLTLRRGETVLVPFGAGEFSVDGSLKVLCCRPPAPDAPTVDRPQLQL